MPKYIANAYLVHQGKIVQTGNEVELTEEQAKRLGDKVEPVEDNKSEDNKHTEASLKKLSADDQKEIVKGLGGNLDEITNEEKRINFILENQ
jgi:hypothetical protein